MAIEFHEGDRIIVVDLSHPVYKVGRKQRLFERKWGCEFEGCDEIRLKKLTIDHLTPVCVAEALGWTKTQIQGDANCQLLCVDHHREKDNTTTEVLSRVRGTGGAIPMQQFLELVNARLTPEPESC